MSSIISTLMVAAIPLFAIGMFVGPITIIISFFNKDEIKKKKVRKIGLWILFGPILLMFALTTLWGILGVISNI